jgi:hypothetical protein
MGRVRPDPSVEHLFLPFHGSFSSFPIFPLDNRSLHFYSSCRKLMHQKFASLLLKGSTINEPRQLHRSPA